MLTFSNNSKLLFQGFGHGRDLWITNMDKPSNHLTLAERTQISNELTNNRNLMGTLLRARH